LSYNLYWDNGLGTTSIEVTDTLVTSYTITGLTQGSNYLFKVRAKNIYGYGDFSPEVTIVPSSVPDTMSAPTTAIDVSYTNIDITWSPPTTNGGDSITAYQVQIFVPTLLDYVEDTVNCDASIVAIRNALKCSIPVSYFISTWSFIRGDSVQARVRAINSNG
jgi:hypothetical protein